MMKNFRVSVWVGILPILISCNIYAPLTSNSTVEDHLEEAQKCLHEGDYGCAIENYEKLPEGDLRKQKLCTVNLARAGFTLSSLINTITQSKDQVLGDLATGLGKWSEIKATSAQAAVTNCLDFKNAATSGDLGILLRTVSLFVDCANRISKTDQFVAVSDSDTDCNTTGNNSGTITKTDVSATSGGGISASQPGMCAADVTACVNDIVAVPASELEGSGLGDIQGAYNQIPADLKNSGAATPVIRGAIYGVISN